jgi:predicted DNA-binding transcriptional regulator AlpA
VGGQYYFFFVRLIGLDAVVYIARITLLSEADMTTRLLTKKQVAWMTGYHPEHVMRLARQDQFPRPIKASDRANCAVRFIEREIEAWVEARGIARGQGAA